MVGQGTAPDPTGGAYDTSADPLVAGEYPVLSILSALNWFLFLILNSRHVYNPEKFLFSSQRLASISHIIETILETVNIIGTKC